MIYADQLGCGCSGAQDEHGLVTSDSLLFGPSGLIHMSVKQKPQTAFLLWPTCGLHIFEEIHFFPCA